MQLFFRVTALAVVAVLFSVSQPDLWAQGQRVRASLKAGVSQVLGIDTSITIQYSRPGVKGRKIWGELVPYGMAPGNNYSQGKPFPWRAGANEKTTIEFSKDATVEGKPLPAGKYAIFMLPGESQWTIIFSKNTTGMAFIYNEAEDALRVTVNPVKAPHQEWLQYGFDDLAGTSATAYLHWETLKVPFKIAVAEPPAPPATQ
ncbi:MAG: DUF2911 domain-containing protein [Acidobacteriota bacterium]